MKSSDIAKAFTPASADLPGGEMVKNTVQTALVGAASAKLVGGNVALSAFNSGFGYLYNQCGGRLDCGKNEDTSPYRTKIQRESPSGNSFPRLDGEWSEWEEAASFGLPDDLSKNVIVKALLRIPGVNLQVRNNTESLYQEFDIYHDEVLVMPDGNGNFPVSHVLNSEFVRTERKPIVGSLVPVSIYRAVFGDVFGFIEMPLHETERLGGY